MAGNRQGKAKKVPGLPPSSDKEFWSEAGVNLIDLKEVEKQIKIIKLKDHYPVYQQGPYFICRGCPFKHTIPLDPNKFMVKEGKIVRK